MRQLKEILAQIKKYTNNEGNDCYIGMTSVEILDVVKIDLSWYNIVSETSYSIEGDSVSEEMAICDGVYRVSVTEYAPAEFASCESSDIEYEVRFTYLYSE